MVLDRIFRAQRALHRAVKSVGLWKSRGGRIVKRFAASMDVLESRTMLVVDFDPPQVLALTGNEQGVVEIEFSDTIDHQALIASGVDVRVFNSTDDLVPGTIAWNPGGTVLTWTPEAGAEPVPVLDDIWTVWLSGQETSLIQDTSGNLLDGDGDGMPGGDCVRIWSVLPDNGGGPGDLPGPAVVSQIQSTADGTATLTFSEPMRSDLIIESFDLMVTDAYGEIVGGYLEWSELDTVLTWASYEEPRWAENWTLWINGGDDSFVKDMAGNILDGDGNGQAGGDYECTWAVAAVNAGGNQADTTPPTVVDFFGTDDGIAEITFSEAMDWDRVDELFDVRVYDSQGQLVPGFIEFDDLGFDRMTWLSDLFPAVDDVWTIVLWSSDQAGFVDFAWNALDGNGDGRPGGSFVAEWEVLAIEDVESPSIIDQTGRANGSVEVWFSEPMDTRNVDNFYDVWVEDSNGDEVTGFIEWNADGDVLYWYSDYLPDQADTWTIHLMGQDSTDFTDLGFNVLTGEPGGAWTVVDDEWAFSWNVGASDDVVAPTAVPVLVDEIGDPVRDGSIRIEFSEAMDAGWASPTHDVWVINDAGQEVPGEVWWEEDDTVLVWSPDIAATGFQDWTIRIDSAYVTDLAGNALDGDNDSVAGGDFVHRWRVGVDDIRPPRVMSFDGRPDGTVIIEFSEEINERAIGPMDVAVMSGKTPVAGTFYFEWVNGAHQMVWSPAIPPTKSQSWTITLRGQDRTDFTDRAGNILDGDRDYRSGGDFVGTWKTSRGSFLLAPDAYEDNDSWEYARMIEIYGGAAQLTELNMSAAGDDDWFCFFTDDVGTVKDRVFIDFANAAGNLDLYLYDGDGGLLASSRGKTDQEVVSLEGLPADLYYVRIAGAANPDYTLTLQAPQLPQSDDSWTMMYYVDGDNYLDGSFYRELDQMEALNLPSDVNVVFLFDRAPGNDGIKDDWSDTRRGVLVKDGKSGIIGSPMTSLGEMNMGSAATLTSFIDWAKAHFPADRYFLNISGPGGGIRGAAWDDTSGGASLQPAEIAGALAAGGVHFDLVEFNTGLNQLAEIGTAMSPYADYMLASEGLSPAGLMAARLKAMESLSMYATAQVADEMAYLAAERTFAEFEDGGKSFQTNQSVLDLVEMNGLNLAMGQFVQAALADADAADWARLIAAANGAPAFMDGGKDLGRFMKTVNRDALLPQSIRDAALGVLDALRIAVYSNYDNGYRADGLAVVLTTTPAYGYASLAPDFVAATGWDGFLSALGDHGAVQSNPVNWEEPNDTLATAFALSPTAGGQLHLGELEIGSPSDVDWFQFQMPAKGNAQSVITIQSDGEGLDPALALFDRSGKLLGLIDTTGQAETFSLNGREAGLYYLRICTNDPAHSGGYELAIDLPAPDAAASVGDWAGNTAKQSPASLNITPGVAVPFTGLSVGTKGDWFTVPLSSVTNDGDGLIRVSSSMVKAPSLVVYNSKGKSMGKGSLDASGDTVFQIPANTTEPILLFIKPGAKLAKNTEQPYTLTLRTPSYHVAQPELSWQSIAPTHYNVQSPDTLAISRSYIVHDMPLGENFTIEYRLSVNDVWGDGDDLLLGSENINISADRSVGAHSGIFSAAIPVGLAVGAQYHVMSRLDSGDAIMEADDNNNLGVADSPVTIAAAPRQFADTGAYDLAYSEAGVLHVGFFDTAANALKVATRDEAGAWGADAVVDNSGHALSDISLAVAPDGNPAMSYYDTVDGALKYAAFDGMEWSVVTVDDAADVGNQSSLAFFADGRPMIAYFDATNLDLKAAQADAQGAWQVAVVDSRGDTGRNPSLAISADDTPRIAFFSPSKKSYRYAEPYKTAWKIRPLVAKQVAAAGRVALDHNAGGLPVAGYFDVLNTDPAFTAPGGKRWATARVPADGVQGLLGDMVYDRANNVASLFYVDEQAGGVRVAQGNETALAGFAWRAGTNVRAAFQNATQIAAGWMDGTTLNVEDF